MLFRSSEDIEDAIFGPVDQKNKLADANEVLKNLFMLSSNATSNDWQLCLKEEEKRKEFYEKLKEYEKLLFMALSNRAIFVEVGLDKIEEYKQDWIFYKKLKNAVALRFDEVEDFSKYEEGVKNLINTFVNASDVVTVVKPVSIGDEKGMEEALGLMHSKEAKADFIKTRIESKLKQVRYDDPLLFEEFSTKIRKTLAEYDASRDEDKYLNEMQILADDFKQGLTSKDYPSIVKSDPDSKAFYGTIISNLTAIDSAIDLKKEELVAEYSIKIKQMIESSTKRDWKHNETVHKEIHRRLDDFLFDLFEDLNINTEQPNNIDVLDLIIDSIMKVAVARY